MRSVLCGVFLLLLLPACTDSNAEPPESELPVTRIRVGNHEITVEVAADRTSLRRGLMFRDSLPEDHGMLFIFPVEQPLSFWMKNTRIPLSIAYADSQGTIVRIADMEPFDESRVPSGAPAQFALEMNQGWFSRKGILVGDRLRNLPRFNIRKPDPDS